VELVTTIRVNPDNNKYSKRDTFNYNDRNDKNDKRERGDRGRGGRDRSDSRGFNRDSRDGGRERGNSMSNSPIRDDRRERERGDYPVRESNDGFNLRGSGTHGVKKDLNNAPKEDLNKSASFFSRFGFRTNDSVNKSVNSTGGGTNGVRGRKDSREREVDEGSERDQKGEIGEREEFGRSRGSGAKRGVFVTVRVAVIVMIIVLNVLVVFISF
jgi:hypothetical protein